MQKNLHRSWAKSFGELILCISVSSLQPWISTIQSQLYSLAEEGQKGKQTTQALDAEFQDSTYNSQYRKYCLQK